MVALNPLEDESHGGTEEVPRRAAGAGHPDGGGGAAGSGHPPGSAGPDRQAAGNQPRDAAQLGDPGRDRRRHPSGHHHRRCDAACRARARGPRAPPGERHSEERVGFLRGGARPPLPLTIRYIDEHKDEFGVEPICKQLQVAPQTYYATKSRPPSKRSLTDKAILEHIRRVHEDNFSVDGAKKVHAELVRQGHRVARCTVERLMRAEGLHGVRRSAPAGPRTPVPGTGPGPRAPAPARPCGPTWSTAGSPPPLRTACGSPTSPTSEPSPAGCTPPS